MSKGSLVPLCGKSIVGLPRAVHNRLHTRRLRSTAIVGDYYIRLNNLLFNIVKDQSRSVTFIRSYRSNVITLAYWLDHFLIQFVERLREFHYYKCFRGNGINGEVGYLNVPLRQKPSAGCEGGEVLAC